METLKINITIDPALYTRNPENTELGKKIVSESIKMINELGFEAFTFKKLGVEIGSNESSIYRYFESKHVLLVYLISWYWLWIEYKLVFATNNVPISEQKLIFALEIITKRITEDNSVSFINEVLLNKVIIVESSKAYHTKDIDVENEKGYYKSYKRVVQRVSDIVLEVNPTFKFPHMLISTVIEGAHHQRYFSQHLPSLTDVIEGNNDVVNFYKNLVLNAIK
ncbi:MAG: AcrR family transcriptional regulator [Planctomycetota bacterium]|jgi:AcrR family transcriptional regulator|uniref:TetR/AcrR family transcriptional regulator n=1 Tax=Patiriisocius sp. Uisw_047 TaxID=3230969 RepID=UPI0039EB74FF